MQAYRRGVLARRIAQKMRDDAALLRLEKENQERIASEQIALELQQRLEAIAKSQPTHEEPESDVELDPEGRSYDLLPTPPAEVVELKTPQSDEFETIKETSDKKSKDKKSKDKKSKGKKSKDKKSSDEKSSDDMSIDEKTSDEKITDEKTSDEKKSGKKKKSDKKTSNLPEPVEEPSMETPEIKIIPLASRSTTPTPSLGEEEEEEDGDDFDDISEEFSFYKFSILKFESNIGHTHFSQRLKQSLLPHDDEGDALACLTVWWIILRFMGDIPEPKSVDSMSVASSTISRHVSSHRQGRRLSSLVGLDQKILRKNKKKLGGRKASMIPEEPENFTEDEDILIGEGPTLDRPLSSLEKLHIIAGYGVTRQDIRDEIYCQICKQLVNNKNRKSRMLGWTLLSICLGIFPPTERFEKYLECFVRKGPSGYGEYCTERLRRILVNGARKELPCWIEEQAAKSKEPIDASVTLLDGRAISVHLDSASTSAEVCQAVAEKIDLRDTHGFSLYITLYEKMWSLGSCEKYVMDAVSQCEQEIRRQGREEKNTPWRLSFRKEAFTPWHDSSADPISTDLIYRQVIKGIKMGEYTSEKEDEYVQLAAKHYYIQFGHVYNKDNVQKVVEECIATPLIENKSMTKWIQLISAEHLQGPYMNAKPETDSVKGELVSDARNAWPLHFSKFYEATMMSGPPLPVSRFVVAVNGNGIFFMDGRDKRLLELPYLEVKEVSMSSSESLSLATVKGVFVLKSTEAEVMTALIEKNLEGLRQRSVYALAQQDSGKSDDPRLLACKRGDLLQVEEDEESSPDKKWIKATNTRTSASGEVCRDTVQFLPTLEKPADDMLEMLSPGQRKPSATQSVTHRDETVAPISIKEFALENFRPAGNVGRQGTPKGVTREKLWACSREPLKQPLMRNLVRNSDLSNLACSAFTAILKYMGDYPIKHARSPMELTDQIFGPATQHEALQDEIYCQIMRQMTNNGSRLSVERGWQLMWLCSGLFPPSPNLRSHTEHFLVSRPRDQLAAGCLQRLRGMYSKEPRKLPPHPVEVDAIIQNSTQIFQKVHFPNDTSDIFEVQSTSKMDELCFSIASQLKLSSADGYGLYLKTPNKVLSLEEEDYFFDSLRLTSEVPKKGKKIKEGNQASVPYRVMFKRKLWFNVSPGKDVIADLTFHFPQELPRYLRGYHNCNKEDMINLGGLLFRVEVDSDRSQFVMIPRMLRELVPADQLKIMSSDEWKKHIISAYNKQSGITVQEAKIAFLKGISSWPTFGCSFFEVKQTCESSYPATILIIISKLGVSFIDPSTKEMMVMHPFSRITDYQCDSGYFEMTIGTLGNIFVCETLHADTMENLLRSYIVMYERQREAFRPKNQMFS